MLSLFAGIFILKIVNSSKKVCGPIYSTPTRALTEKTSQVEAALYFPDSNRERLVAYIIYDYRDEGSFGIDVDGEKVYTCSNSTLGLGRCKDETIGALLLNPKSPPKYPYSYGSSSWQSLIEIGSLDAKESGYYCVHLINPQNLFGTFKAVFTNAHGRLPSEIYPLFKFNYWLVVFYSSMLFIWLASCLLLRRTVCGLQLALIPTLTLGVLESILAYHRLSIWNIYGKRALSYDIGSFVGIAKEISFLAFMMLTSIGFGISRTSLTTKSRIWILRLLGFHLMAAIIPYMSNSNTLQTSLPYCFTMSVILVFIWKNLMQTRDYLVHHKHAAQLSIYSQLIGLFKLLAALIFVFMALATWRVYTFENSLSWHAASWQSLWFYKSGWHLTLYALSILIVSIIFRPSDRLISCETNQGTSASKSPQ